MTVLLALYLYLLAGAGIILGITFALASLIWTIRKEIEDGEKDF